MANRTKPSRGPDLNPQRIGEVALRLIDAEGLAALSARRLAAALGCEAMSLYHHVKGMDGVLDEVVDRLFDTQEPLPALECRSRLAVYASNFLGLADAHPRAFPLIATRRWRTPNAILAAGLVLEAFESLGLKRREALRRARVFGAYLNGAGLARAAWRETPDITPRPLKGLGAAQSPEAVASDLDMGLGLLLDALCQA